MMDWELLYRRLVARLEEIADEGEWIANDALLLEYDKVARAHARTAAHLPVRGGEPPSKEALLAAEGAG